jgi:hypothetical protein
MPARLGTYTRRVASGGVSPVYRIERHADGVQHLYRNGSLVDVDRIDLGDSRTDIECWGRGNGLVRSCCTATASSAWPGPFIQRLSPSRTEHLHVRQRPA